MKNYCRNLNGNFAKHLNNKYYQLKQNWLVEAHHIRNFGENNQYRATLKCVIAEQLWRNRHNHVCKIFQQKYDDIPQYCIENIFLNPFKTDPVFSAIDTLKIYLAKSYNDSFVLLDETVNDLVDDEYTPLFKLTGDHINVLSIFICVEPKLFTGSKQEFINDVTTKLSHELTHAIDSIVDKLGFIKSGTLNELINVLSRYNNYVDEDNIRDNLEINNVYDFIWVMKELLYYTQKTEIAAYLDTFYNQLSYNKNQDIDNNDIFLRYQNLNQLLNIIILHKNRFQQKYCKQIELIINQLYLIKNEQLKNIINPKKESTIYNFNVLINYFNKQIQNFIRKANHIYEQF